MIKEEIDLKIKQVRVAMYNHTHNFKDFTDLVDYQLTYNEWKGLLDHTEKLEEQSKQVNKAIEFISVYEDVNLDDFDTKKLLSKLLEILKGE